MLSALSFRQLLLAGFLFIAILLSGISVHTLLTLERLTKQSRSLAHQTVLVTDDTQRLAEKTIAMERSARQYLVLDDIAFRDIYLAARQDALLSLSALIKALPSLPTQAVAEWTQQSELIWQTLLRRQLDRPITDSDQKLMSRAFVRLPEINYQLEIAGKREIERRNELSLIELERQRSLLMSLVVGTMIFAILLALMFGLWLSRPLAQIELVIGRLGENKFDQIIEVNGPADLRKLGEQLDWLRQRLADLEADKARFLRNISHELKTPLAALREGVALLEDGIAGELSDKQSEIVRILSKNTGSLQGQIEDLLRYNGAAFDAQHLQLSSVDLNQLLHAVCDAQCLQIEAQCLQLRLPIESGTSTQMLIDAEKIAVVLANLLANAIRFSPPGGLISFVIAHAGKYWHIDCIDQGPGVASADAARIFDPFYQGARQPTGARSGNGIGLAIVLEYITAHGGNVQLLPAEVGAHFRIKLPQLSNPLFSRPSIL
ncbi:ATP-binding protein [Undibacterium sp. Ren11W]|uniref:ATP-binding protein n=1 Tax=Undibacterium sp. Ren11W TaxID=3413045 RepID=UPI003BF3CD10